MLEPGAIEGIPEEAEVLFEERWNRNRPGTRQTIAYLPLENGRRLVTFPFRGWSPPIGETIRCVLYPNDVGNTAFAAPVGGIPEGESADGSEWDRDFGGRNHRSMNGSFNSGEVHGVLGEQLKAVDEAYTKITDGMDALNEALNRLEDSIRSMEGVDEEDREPAAAE